MMDEFVNFLTIGLCFTFFAILASNTTKMREKANDFQKRVQGRAMSLDDTVSSIRQTLTSQNNSVLRTTMVSNN